MGAKSPLNYVPKLPQYVEYATFKSTDFPNVTRGFVSNLTVFPITKLHFLHTNTTRIAADAFLDLKNLTTLEVSNCPRLVTADVMDFLQETTILKRILLQENNWTNIPKFPVLKNSLIAEISLKNNSITTASGLLFSGLHSLKKLDFSYNKLHTLNTSGFESTSITHLNLARNRLPSIPSFCRPDGTPTGKYRSLDFTSNRIFEIGQDSFECLPNLLKIVLDNNPISILYDRTFSALPRLGSLSISLCSNRLKTIQPFAFDSSSLVKLIFTHNDFKFSRLDGFTNKRIFGVLPNLTTLDLTSNYLPTKCRQLRMMLSPLKNVQNLILQDTSLQCFRNVFQHLPSLMFLVLKGNSIVGWNDEPDVFGNVTSLKHLYLDDNNIKQVNKTSFPAGFLQSLETIALSRNKFSCTCDLMWFVDWLRSTDITVYNYPREYKCRFPNDMNGKLLKYYTPTVEWCSTTDNLLTYICIGLSLTFIVMTIVVSLGYRYRFYLRYWLHILGIRRMGYQRIEDDTDYQYDAFVIYCHDDQAFVFNNMIPELEEKAGCRLCVHERDFHVGRFILDNIISNIELSRNVILVLSQTFLDSEWCRYELNLTQTRLIQEGPGVLTVILLEDLKCRVLPSTIRSVLDTVTYNEWPVEEAGRRRFWARILTALNKQPLEIPE